MVDAKNTEEKKKNNKLN